MFRGDFDLVTLMGGEIHLHPRLEEIIKETVSRNYKFSFTSNGYEFEKYQFLLASKFSDYFSHITFSLDGLEKSHDVVRRKGSYKRVLEAIQFYSLQENLDVAVNITLSKLSHTELSEILAVLSKYKLAKIMVGSVIKNGFNDNLALSFEERRDAYSTILEENKKFGNLVSTMPLYTDAEKAPCQRLFSQDENLYFDENGNLLFCCNLALGKSKILSVENTTQKEEIKRITRHYIGKTKAFWLVKNYQGLLSPLEKGSCEFCNLNSMKIRE